MHVSAVIMCLFFVPSSMRTSAFYRPMRLTWMSSQGEGTVVEKVVTDGRVHTRNA